MNVFNNYPYANLIADLEGGNENTRSRLNRGLLKILNCLRIGGIVPSQGLIPDQLLIVHNSNPRFHEVCFTNFVGFTVDQPPTPMVDLRLFINCFLSLLTTNTPPLNNIDDYMQYYHLAGLDPYTIIPTIFGETIRTDTLPPVQDDLYQWQFQGEEAVYGYLAFNEFHHADISALLAKYLIFQPYGLGYFPRLLALTPHYVITNRDPSVPQHAPNAKIVHVAATPGRIRLFLVHSLTILSILFSKQFVIVLVTIQNLLRLPIMEDGKICLQTMEEIVAPPPDAFHANKIANMLQLADILNLLIENHDQRYSHDRLAISFREFQQVLIQHPHLPPSFFLFHPIFENVVIQTLPIDNFFDQLLIENSTAIVNRLNEHPEAGTYRFELSPVQLLSELVIIQTQFNNSDNCYRFLGYALRAIRIVHASGIVHGFLQLTNFFILLNGQIMPAIHGFEEAIDFGNIFPPVNEALEDIRAIGSILNHILKIVPWKLPVLTEIAGRLLAADNYAVVTDIISKLP